ncbi:MAG: IclR family transcriptional regulator C-terminal domain-containing protein, partial [Acinetobacter sp.]
QLKTIALSDACLSKEEHELGIIALAVPVLNTKGQVIGALNCMSQTNLTSEEYLIQQVLPLLRQTANELRSLI